jgi:hypothetical protein
VCQFLFFFATKMLESLFSSSYVTFALALLVIGLATKIWSVLQQRKRDEVIRRQRQLLEQVGLAVVPSV